MFDRNRNDCACSFIAADQSPSDSPVSAASFLANVVRARRSPIFAIFSESDHRGWVAMWVPEVFHDWWPIRAGRGSTTIGIDASPHKYGRGKPKRRSGVATPSAGSQAG
jgi:hypothetical protein